MISSNKNLYLHIVIYTQLITKKKAKLKSGSKLLSKRGMDVRRGPETFGFMQVFNLGAVNENS